MTLPRVNVEDSQQNAFVQEWLSAWQKHHADSMHITDHRSFEYAIELIQETYNYEDHQDREGNEVVDTGDIAAALRVLRKLMILAPVGDEVYRALELSYAFVNAVDQMRAKTKG
jgi:hypothetical protein